MRLALDIESECAVDGCDDSACLHALDEYKNKITVVGIYDGTEGKVFRNLDDLKKYFTKSTQWELVGANLKFDLRVLAAHGVDLTPYWADDCLLQASVSLEKIPETWMLDYQAERKRLNAEGGKHRDAGPLSLKALAPYFLNVQPFWESTDHNNDEYVLKDAKYAYELCEYFDNSLKREGSYKFYKEKLLPWSKMLLRMEQRGIALDLDGVESEDVKAKQVASEARRNLDEMWADAYKKYTYIQQEEAAAKYYDMEKTAIQRMKAPSDDKIEKVKSRYNDLFVKAALKIEPLSLDSPTQLTWLLRDYLKLDITDFDGEEGTGIVVLEKLAGQGREDVAEFIKYRKATKLTTAFFPSYRAMHVDGIIHCSFNPLGTRTGRLSSSRPNLQQVARGIKRLFQARPGYKFCVRDMKAIEPYLICYYTYDLNLYDIISKDKDFHNFNTAIFFDLDATEKDFKKKYAKEREVGKEVGLSLLYGSGQKRLMESAQKRGFIWSKKEAQYKVERFKEFYSDAFRFREEVINPALLDGGSITNIMGRPFVIPDPTEIHMKGMNTLIQGGASDLVCNSAHRVQAQYELANMDAHVVILEHDCIIVEAAENEAEQADAMLNIAMTDYKLNTPLGPLHLLTEGGVCDRWEK